MRVDTLIRGARVVDGSGGDVRALDVGIIGDRLAVLAPGASCEAVRTVDATGLHLAPGFIDIHTHDDTVAVTAPAMQAKLSQGVTTVVVGNCGISASPVTLRGAPPNPMNLLGGADAFRYPRFADYAAAIEQARPNANVAALVGHTALRANHLERLDRAATPGEIDAMRRQLREALDEGAIGLSSGLAYDSARAAPTAEVMALVEELAAHDALYTTHLRTEFEGVFDAIREALDTAAHGRVRLLVSHLKCAGAGTWGRSGELLAQLDAGATGQPVACDCYPYAASASTIDPEQVRPGTTVWISGSTPHPEQAGRGLDAIAADWGMSEVDAARRLMPGGAVYHCMQESDVQAILAHPRTMIGSDGLPADPRPHPRLWGTFPRVLGHYSRELGLFDLPTAVHRMTGLSADWLRLERRGRIADGFHADLVLFDAARIRDRATYEAPTQPADGIVEVWVNGVPSHRPDIDTPGRAGRLLRRGPSPTFHSTRHSP